MTPVRLLDTGMRPVFWNLALSAVLAERHRVGAAPGTLRFQSFPRCAILGRHQILEREIDTGWCKSNDVVVSRRITGGGAIVMEPGILGWELLLPAAMFGRDLGEAVRRICTAVASGLSRLGVDARFRPRNDIEIDGRKVSGTGGYFDGPTLLYQGTAIIDLDRELLRRALRWPADKLDRHGAAAIDDRVTDLCAATGRPVRREEVVAALAAGFAEGLGLALEPAALADEEAGEAELLMASEIGTRSFIAGDARAAGASAVHLHPTPGGAIQVLVDTRPLAGRPIERVVFAGDFFVNPPRAIADLEAALRDVPAAEAPALVERRLAEDGLTLLGCRPADFAAALAAALAE